MLQQQRNEWVHSKARRRRDIYLATAALPIGVPLAASTALLSRVIDGPHPFFKQERVGKNGEPFVMRKIRSMPTSCGDRTPSRGALDSRASRLGRLLRLTTLDELPQLLNILNGDLSIFGPRALLEKDIKIMEEVVPSASFARWYDIYTLAGPGCLSTFGHATHGLAREPERAYLLRTELDIYDYDHATPANDMKLLCRAWEVAARVARTATSSYVTHPLDSR